MVDRVEAVVGEQALQVVLLAGPVGLSAGQHVVEKLLHHAGEFRRHAAGRAEAVQLGAAAGREQKGIGAQQRRHGQRIVFGGQQGVIAREQARLGSAFVDGEVIDHRVHGERDGMFQALFGFAHDGGEPVLGFGSPVGRKEKPHAAAGHSAKHPEAPEILAHGGARPADERIRVQVSGPGDDGLDGTVEVALRFRSDAADIVLLQPLLDLVQDAYGFLPSLPLGLGSQQILFGHHLEDGADVLRHAAVDQHQALLQPFARGGRDLIHAEDLVPGQQTAAADSKLRIALGGAHAVDQLDAGPHAARILPAAAGTAEPFSEDGPRGHQAAVFLIQAAGDGMNLPGGAHARRDEAAEQAGGDGQA